MPRAFTSTKLPMDSSSYQGSVYASGLWIYDPKTFVPIPNMAESWTTSADGKTFTFKLRRDMKWSDGVPITARDFEWTYAQASNPANSIHSSTISKRLARTKRWMDYTLEVTLSEATCVGLSTVDAVTPLL